MSRLAMQLLFGALADLNGRGGRGGQGADAVHPAPELADRVPFDEGHDPQQPTRALVRGAAT